MNKKVGASFFGKCKKMFTFCFELIYWTFYGKKSKIEKENL